MDIVGERAKHYGDGKDNLNRVARVWGAYLGVTMTPADVCWLMVMLKASRAAIDPKHEDNYIDAKGYIELAERLR